MILIQTTNTRYHYLALPTGTIVVEARSHGSNLIFVEGFEHRPQLLRRSHEDKVCVYVDDSVFLR